METANWTGQDKPFARQIAAVDLDEASFLNKMDSFKCGDGTYVEGQPLPKGCGAEGKLVQPTFVDIDSDGDTGWFGSFTSV